MTTQYDDSRWTITTDRRMDVSPVGDRVLVRPVAPEKLTKGGLIIPDSATRHPQVGRVVAAGPGRHSVTGVLLPMPVKPGDLVFFSRYAGSAVKMGQDDALVLMSVEDVQAVATEPQVGPCPLCQGRRE